MPPFRFASCPLSIPSDLASLSACMGEAGPLLLSRTHLAHFYPLIRDYSASGT
jgi:hypothetical protein